MACVRLIAAAACLVGAAGAAHAGDGFAQPAETRCAAYGAGFAPLEGSDACVKISAHVRVEVSSSSNWRIRAPSGLGATGEGLGLAAFPEQPPRARAGAHSSVTSDGRIRTEMGEVRTYLRLNATRGLTDAADR